MIVGLRVVNRRLLLHDNGLMIRVILRRIKLLGHEPVRIHNRNTGFGC